jgi:hypothetical protein
MNENTYNEVGTDDVINRKFFTLLLVAVIAKVTKDKLQYV